MGRGGVFIAGKGLMAFLGSQVGSRTAVTLEAGPRGVTYRWTGLSWREANESWSGAVRFDALEQGHRVAGGRTRTTGGRCLPACLPND
jgi:hypothetical protein